MSAKFSDFLTPTLPPIPQIHAISLSKVAYYVCFWRYPPPPQCGRHKWKPPQMKSHVTVMSLTTSLNRLPGCSSSPRRSPSTGRTLGPGTCPPPDPAASSGLPRSPPATGRTFPGGNCIKIGLPRLWSSRKIDSQRLFPRKIHSVFFIRDSLKMSLERLLNFSRILSRSVSKSVS